MGESGKKGIARLWAGLLPRTDSPETKVPEEWHKERTTSAHMKVRPFKTLDQALGLGAIDVVEGELDVVGVGERRRFVVAVGGQEKGFVEARVVVAVRFIVHAG